MSVQFDLHAQAPPRSARSKWDEQNEQAQITFHKTIDGHYRYGKTGYARVACLFLTWLEDDIQCKETEVDTLREIFANSFHFETHYFLIPSQKWRTALQLKVADFVHTYNSRDCMVIIYYGGHGYVGEETHKLKLSAKWQADGNGDPTAFFNDIQTCLRLPECDQLLIIDCCYAAKAFVRHHIGQRKFELLTSAGVEDKVPSPTMQGSFTKCLSDVLKMLLSSNPEGFSTSRLYRELFHAFDPQANKPPRPHLFDQARDDLGRIWLRPQIETCAPTNPSREERSVHLKLSLQLNKPPNNALMNELATALQYLPHVDKVEFKDLYAPRRQLEIFTHSIIQAQRLRPLIRKIVARKRLKGLMEKIGRPPSIRRMLLEQNHQSLYDWSDWSNAVKEGELGSRPNGSPRKKSFTWPVAMDGHTVTTRSIYNRLFSIDLAVGIPGRSLISSLFTRRADADVGSTHSSESMTVQGLFPPISTANPTALDPVKVAASALDGHSWREHLHGVETWYILIFIAMFFELGCFCIVMRD